jgi:hypothetical protein
MQSSELSLNRLNLLLPTKPVQGNQVATPVPTGGRRGATYPHHRKGRGGRSIAAGVGKFTHFAEEGMPFPPRWVMVGA